MAKNEIYWTLIDARSFILQTAKEFERLESKAIETGAPGYIVTSWEKKKDEAVQELAKLDTFLSERFDIDL